MAISSKFAIALLLFVIFLSGCTSTEIRPGDNPQLNESDGIMFGLVEHNFYDVDGKKIPTGENSGYLYRFDFGYLDRGWAAKNYEPVKVFAKGNGTIAGDTSKQNYLFVHSLPEGKYSIDEMVITIYQLTHSVRLLNMVFGVEPNKATYVGNIILDFSPTKNIFGRMKYSTPPRITIVNSLDDTSTIYEAEYPKLNYEIISDATGSVRKSN